MLTNEELVDKYVDATVFVIEQTLLSYGYEPSEVIKEGYEPEALLSDAVLPVIAGYLLAQGVSIKTIDSLANNEEFAELLLDKFSQKIKDKYDV